MLLLYLKLTFMHRTHHCVLRKALRCRTRVTDPQSGSLIAFLIDYATNIAYIHIASAIPSNEQIPSYGKDRDAQAQLLTRLITMFQHSRDMALSFGTRSDATRHDGPLATLCR